MDVICIGNAIVDILVRCPEADIARLEMRRGAMTLIDEAQAAALYREMAGPVEMPGGSAANTAVGIASLGGQAGFVGKLRQDRFGALFADDIRAAGVAFATPLATSGPSTARSLIFITPDGQRTMNTCLGISAHLNPADIDPAVIAAGACTYMEGYLWDKPAAREAFLTAARLAHAHGRRVSLTLSDPFCVERHRESFLALIRDHIDLLFANEMELLSLYQTSDRAAALAAIRQDCRLAAVTRGEQGSIIVSAEQIETVPATPATQVVDTTGAGDLYAAGFLYGLTRDYPPRRCAELGGQAAATVIAHIGVRAGCPG